SDCPADSGRLDYAGSGKLQGGGVGCMVPGDPPTGPAAGMTIGPPHTIHRDTQAFCDIRLIGRLRQPAVPPLGVVAPPVTVREPLLRRGPSTSAPAPACTGGFLPPP